MAERDEPGTAPALRWGILGAGGIARTFAYAVGRHTSSQVVAVGSRSAERAQRFASLHGIPKSHGDYAALVADPEVEAVYIASPHSEHHEHALLAIEAGRHVLVEKAFTQNAMQAAQVIDAARAAGVFLMEAMWTRFLPHVAELRRVVQRGEIGELVGMIADHGQSMGHLPPTHRVHDPRLAGGALLDLGVYPVSFAHDLFGAPSVVRAVGSLTPTGVDGQVAMALSHGERVQTSLHTTLWAQTATTAVVFGTTGRIEIAGRFYAPTSFVVVHADGTHWEYDGAVEGGFQYEVAEVSRCVAEGMQESPRMSWAGTLDVMGTLDEVRRQVGVVYPGE